MHQVFENKSDQVNRKYEMAWIKKILEEFLMQSEIYNS